MKSYDVIIVGGGITGATFACALAQRCQGKLQIALIDSVALSQEYHPSYDARTLTLSAESILLLEQLNLWAGLDSHATPIHSIHVSDQGYIGNTEFCADDYDVSELGAVVELADVHRHFLPRLLAYANLDVLSPCEVVEVTRTLDAVSVTLIDGQCLTASLLVCADGSDSISAKKLGISTLQTDFQQTALIANITLEKDHQCRAYERFTQQGPLALLPMSQNRCAVVWCVDRAQANEMLAWSDSSFMTQLQRTFGWRLGAITHVGKRASYPLVMHQASRFISHRTVLVGNAAQTLHPIAGQGFNLGLRDVISLVEEIEQTWSREDDVGGMPILIRYQARRKSDKQATTSLTSGLVSVFSTSFFPLVVARNLGLLTMDMFPTIKRPLIKRTMGRISR